MAFLQSLWDKISAPFKSLFAARGNNNRPLEFRKLTRAEAAAAGVSYTAKRKVPKDTVTVTKDTPLFTDRQVAELRIGDKKESQTEKYAPLKEIIPGLTEADRRFLIKADKEGQGGKSRKTKRFKDLFAKYDRTDVLEALGSGKVLVNWAA